jgi:UDP-glucose 4-epimerase
MAKNVLVTGGCGFIGGWVVNTLLKNGYYVVVIDKETRFGLFNDHTQCEYYYADLQSYQLQRLLSSKNIDYIVHLGAYSTVRDALHDPKGIVENNILATSALLNAIEQTDYKPKKIIFASSSAAIEPTTSYYGMSKRTCEDMLRIFSEVTGIATISLRFGNVYGPAQNPKNGTLIAKLVGWAYHIKNGLPYEPVKIFGDGKQTRDYVYVMDVVGAIQTCIENDMPACIENVSTGWLYTTNEAIECFRGCALGHIPRIPMPQLEHTVANSFDKDDVKLPQSKRLRELGWGADMRLYVNIAEALTWRLNTEPMLFEHRFDSEGRIL